MTLTQETFLGASIRNFSSTMGWGNQPSVLDVGLVEDPSNGDSFNPPQVGRPVYFDYQGWQFGGILQNYSEVEGEQGNPLHQAQVQDPRELLTGIQLILQDYSGVTYGMPNLYNIYGYLETAYGYGGSLSNDTGIPWQLVRDAFWYLQLASPIQFRGYTYLLLPFAAANLLPSYYRIGGGIITALDYIENICDAVGHDYFVDLWRSSFGATGGDIYVYTVDRRYPLITGAIDDFVDSIDGAVSKENGYELVNATTGKFCIGGKKAVLWVQNSDIEPYWGLDRAGNVIRGAGDFESVDGSDYVVTLNGLSLYIETGITTLINYQTDLAELRHAMMGKDDWEAFLWSKNNIPGSIHNGKASRIGVTEQCRIDWFLRNTKTRPAAVVKVGKGVIDLENNERIQKNLDIIYEFVKMYATEYYGKKFMVPVPSVYGKIEPDTYRIILTHRPIEAGYASDIEYDSMRYNGTMPFNSEKFMTEDNRVKCYARFSGITDSEDLEDSVIKSKYGLEYLNIEDYVIDVYEGLNDKIRENLFVGANVDENLVFLNNTRLFSPRAVITLSAQIVDNVSSKTTMSEGGKDLFIAYVSDFATSEEELRNMLNNIERAWKGFGGDYFNFGKFARCYKPDIGVIPLESNLLRYGPWVSQARIDNDGNRVTGKVECEIDDSLVPWEYGGFIALENAGLAKVADAAAGQQISEYGSVQFPGVPNKQLGEALLDAGPIITDVSVNVAEEGVTTTYRMNTWSYRFGSLGKYNVEKLKQISLLAQKQRKALRKLFEYTRPPNREGERLLEFKSRESRRHSAQSSHPFIGAEVFIDGSGDSLSVRTGAASLAGYHLIGQVSPSSYQDQAIMSMDGIFIPYTTKTEVGANSYLPHFEAPTANATTPTVEDLNPFGDDSIILASTDQSQIPDNLINDGNNSSTMTKGVGLKAPIIVGGWGYDTNGVPVPNSGDGNFISNYKNRADQWKVGPIDLRWDDDRKLWATGSTSLTKPFKLTENLLYGRSALAVPMIGFPSGIYINWSEGSGIYRLYDYMLISGTQHFVGDRVIAEQMSFTNASGTNTIWVVINGQCSCYE